MKKITHSTEVELCAEAIAQAQREGWTAHQEVCDFDFVLVGHGLTVGVEAKIAQNMKVLAQASTRRRYSETPDYIAVLTSGFADRGFGLLCTDLRLIHWSIAPGHRPATILHHIDTAGEDFRCDGPPLKLPSIVDGSPAGSPSPIRLTEWKESALRLFAIIEALGAATTADFKRLRLYPRNWVTSGWIEKGPEKATYVKGPQFRRIPDQHPDVFDRFVAEVHASGTRGAT